VLHNHLEALSGASGCQLRVDEIKWQSLTRRLHWRALPDPGQGVGGSAKPPAQRFDPPSQPGLHVGGEVLGATVRCCAVGLALEGNIERPGGGAVLLCRVSICATC